MEPTKPQKECLSPSKKTEHEKYELKYRSSSTTSAHLALDSKSQTSNFTFRLTSTSSTSEREGPALGSLQDDVMRILKSNKHLTTFGVLNAHLSVTLSPTKHSTCQSSTTPKNEEVPQPLVNPEPLHQATADVVHQETIQEGEEEITGEKKNNSTSGAESIEWKAKKPFDINPTTGLDKDQKQTMSERKKGKKREGKKTKNLLPSSSSSSSPIRTSAEVLLRDTLLVTIQDPNVNQKLSNFLKDFIKQVNSKDRVPMGQMSEKEKETGICDCGLPSHATMCGSVCLRPHPENGTSLCYLSLCKTRPFPFPTPPPIDAEDEAEDDVMSMQNQCKVVCFKFELKETNYLNAFDSFLKCDRIVKIHWADRNMMESFLEKKYQELKRCLDIHGFWQIDEQNFNQELSGLWSFLLQKNPMDNVYKQLAEAKTLENSEEIVQPLAPYQAGRDTLASLANTSNLVSFDRYWYRKNNKELYLNITPKDLYVLRQRIIDGVRTNGLSKIRRKTQQTRKKTYSASSYAARASYSALVPRDGKKNKKVTGYHPHKYGPRAQRDEMHDKDKKQSVQDKRENLTLERVLNQSSKQESRSGQGRVKGWGWDKRK